MENDFSLRFFAERLKMPLKFGENGKKNAKEQLGFEPAASPTRVI